MKRVLVTGAAGFIGSHLCDHLLKKNFKVIGLDNLLTGSTNNIEHNFRNKNFTFIEHDVRLKIDINQKLDYILHFASPASPSDYLKYPIETLQTGAVGTENMLKLALRDNARIIVASTSEIYGDPLEHPQSESYFGNVNPIGPRSVYDEAKRYQEAITAAYMNNKNLNVGIIRIFNTYGSRMRINDGRAIPNFLNQAINNKDFTVYGNGMQTRSFCYISDTINGIFKLLKSNYQLPINIGNPKEFTILDLVELIRQLIPTKSVVKYKELPKNDPKMRKPNIELAKKILNWSPKIDLIEGLKETIKHY
jgi:dTDP-glucose 4,6-dehydratase